MEELTQRLQQLETQVGQQHAVIEHQQEKLMRQQTQGWEQAGDVCG